MRVGQTETSNIQIRIKFTNISKIFKYVSNILIHIKYSNIYKIFKYVSNIQICIKYSNMYQIFKNLNSNSAGCQTKTSNIKKSLKSMKIKALEMLVAPRILECFVLL